VFAILPLLPGRAEAQFTSRFSLTVGEEYTDNLFYERDREDDLVTFIIPTLSFSYVYPAEVSPRFTLSLAPAGHIYVRHSELNNFGFTASENAAVTTGFTYPYSPRLTFHLTESLHTSGRSRLTGEGESTQDFPRPPTGFPSSGSVGRRSGDEDSVSLGDVISNEAGIHARYLYSPDITFTAGYRNSFSIFRDEGGTEMVNAFNVRGAYHVWTQTGLWPQHNLHAGYGISLIKTREDGTDLVHNFDIGDDYFSSFMIKLAPTLTLSGSSGLSINSGGSGPRLANNTQLALIKLWELASLTLSFRRGLTGSLGIAGTSLTTSFSTSFYIRLTEYLTGTAGTNFSMYNTDKVNFNIFSAYAGLTYPITTWLQSGLRYTHRIRDAGAGAERTDLESSGRVYTNNVVLTLTAYFDIWPNPGLARVIPTSLTYPALIRQREVQPAEPAQPPPGDAAPSSGATSPPTP
jgi:hypothetical protein